MEVRARSCDRATEFVSRELDGELSMFERALLGRHLQRCEPCAVYARQVAAVTEMVRAAPLEPIRVRNDVWRLPRRVSRLVQKVAVTAAVAAVGIWLVVASLETTRGRAPVTGGVAGSKAGAVTDDRHDWSAGLPRSMQVVQLLPGGLYGTSLGY
jgi:predicted anti-sigma-YlaC factor YlaD